MRELYTSGEGRDLLRGLPGSEDGRRSGGRRLLVLLFGTSGFVSGGSSPTTFTAGGVRAGSVTPCRRGTAAVDPTQPWPEFWLDSFPLAWAPFIPGSMPRDWRIWRSWSCLLPVPTPHSDDHSSALGVICGFGIAFFVVYQIFDAVRSAKAIQMAQPIPDPFGLAATFSGGAKIEPARFRWARSC